MEIAAHDTRSQLQIATPQRTNSHLVASNKRLQVNICVTISLAETNRLCVFCSRLCRTFEPCGSFDDPCYGGRIIRQNSKKMAPAKCTTRHAETDERYVYADNTIYRLDNKE